MQQVNIFLEQKIEYCKSLFTDFIEVEINKQTVIENLYSNVNHENIDYTLKFLELLSVIFKFCQIIFDKTGENFTLSRQ